VINFNILNMTRGLILRLAFFLTFLTNWDSAQIMRKKYASYCR